MSDIGVVSPFVSQVHGLMVAERARAVNVNTLSLGYTMYILHTYGMAV